MSRIKSPQPYKQWNTPWSRKVSSRDRQFSLIMIRGMAEYVLFMQERQNRTGTVGERAAR